jgi:hypothetical protein
VGQPNTIMAPAHTRVVASVSSAHPASAPLPRCFRAPRLRLGSAPPIRERASNTTQILIHFT